MTPHDLWLEPDDESEQVTETCDRCGGWGWIDADPEHSGDCPDCEGSGQVVLTDAAIQQKEFDDFDPPDNDYGGDL